jgi:hypothetical protein
LLAHPGFALLLASGLTALVGLVKIALRPLRWQRLALVPLTLASLGGLAALAYPTARALDAYYHDPRYARDDYRSLVAYLEALTQPNDVIILNTPVSKRFLATTTMARSRPPLPRDSRWTAEQQTTLAEAT